MLFLLFCAVAILGSLGIYLADLPSQYLFMFLGILFFLVPFVFKNEEEDRDSKIRSARICGTLFLAYALFLFFIR